MSGGGVPEPMLAVLTGRRFSDENWVFERKLDGVRALCAGDRGEIRLWSRNQKSMDASYPELIDAMRTAGPADFVVDGEIVAFDGGQTSFAALQPRVNLTDPGRVRDSAVEVFYYIFDVLRLDGKDMTRLPLRERKSALRGSVRFGGPIRLSTHRNAEGERFYEQACARGWEGLIAKRADATYRSGRSADWLKFKCVRDQEFVVGGFTEPTGSRVGFGALLVGYHHGDRFRYAGKVGTGYDQSLLRGLRSTMDGLEVDDPPFTDPVREQRVHWVRPELVVQVGFSEWTRDGKLRHPRFTGVRKDKAPADVVRESE